MRLFWYTSSMKRVVYDVLYDAKLRHPGWFTKRDIHVPGRNTVWDIFRLRRVSCLSEAKADAAALWGVPVDKIWLLSDRWK